MLRSLPPNSTKVVVDTQHDTLSGLGGSATASFSNIPNFVSGHSANTVQYQLGYDGGHNFEGDGQTTVLGAYNTYIAINKNVLEYLRLN